MALIKKTKYFKKEDFYYLFVSLFLTFAVVYLGATGFKEHFSLMLAVFFMDAFFLYLTVKSFKEVEIETSDLAQGNPIVVSLTEKEAKALLLKIEERTPTQLEKGACDKIRRAYINADRESVVSKNLRKSRQLGTKMDESGQRVVDGLKEASR